MAIEPSANAYGNKARVSAVADWLELLAWHERPITLAAAVDYLGDLTLSDGIRLPEDDEAEDTDEEELTDRIRSVLSRRVEMLGALYPFELRGDRLTLRDGVSATDDFPYILLLSITVAHAYEVGTTMSPEDAFEAVVARCLNTRMRAADLGNLRDSCESFHEAVLTAGTSVGLAPNPSSASSATAAWDEGVDTIGHWDWGDERPGRWSVIGQATCGTTATWKGKMAEPKAGIWSTRLGEKVRPIGFLAVPHHVEDRHLYYLVETGERSVVDRIRLTICQPELSVEEQALVSEVFAAGVAAP
jgi:hypothetical protein